ncbi:hypothetical protein GE061_005841 [Apolygus lucorum]|uniref:Peptidase M14 domain-containing protein n=1 Tax=Apolygus lucorum TaxID=248454 RepID=A0A8S9WXH7_APOLU|nr:hypothetical protein GE061_005841 [Apolygus lucorum]
MNLLRAGVGCGGSDDYMKSKNAKYVYTVEMVGGGKSGFDLPESEMFPAIQEMWPGLKEMAIYLINEKNGQRRTGSRAINRASTTVKPAQLMRSYMRGQASPYASRTRIE